jgi:anthranilate synthase/aminodeoxychorismate synthase-like glutamine amidotransferase
MILIVDNYDSFTFNIFQTLEECGARCRVIRNDAIDTDGIASLRPQALVISPGPGNPDGAGITLAAIREFAGRLPILGVCLGHQAIGQAFGGRVVRAARLMHGKVSRIRHDGRGLYRGLKNPFTGTRYHSLVVERASLPPDLEVTAETADGTIMGLRHRRFAIEGVQFHPESILTDEGKRLFTNFLRNAA